MSITPTAATPAVLPGAGAVPALDPATPDHFTALVHKALAGAHRDTPAPAAATGSAAGTPGQPDPAPTGPTAGTDPAPASATDPVAEATLAATAAAAGLSALVAQVLPTATIPAGPGTAPASVTGVAAAAATGTASPTAGPATGTTTGTASPGTGTAPGTAPGPVATTAAQGPASAVTVTPAGAATTRTAAPATATTTGHQASPASGDGRADASASPTSADLPVTQPGDGHAGQGSGTSTDAGTPRQDAVPVPPTTGPTAGPAPATAVPPSAPVGAPTSAPAAAPAASAPVTGQVFPEVTSLVSRGDGVHRITLSLKPEALGEVRVVMTVRDGAVHVRLAAGHDAQQALLQGSPELTRLLEHAGATNTRIVVRDLFGAAAPATSTSTDTNTGTSTGHGTDLGQGQGLGAGSNRSQDQHAGTRAEHHATDGRHDTNTGGATVPRPAQPVTRTRLSGVDVTM